jgi:tagatose-1,6-bisphosphate aldolase
VKFVFFHRAERPDAIDEHRRVRDLVAACHAVGLPCVIEPLWYPLDGEDPSDPDVVRARARAIVTEAAEFASCGADVLKVQFPGEVRDVATRAQARAACRELDECLRVPWVLLSESVAYSDFAVQLELAAAAGASGFMAGRAVWSEVVTSGGGRVAIASAADRLAALTALLRANGRPWRERVPPADVASHVVPDWWSASA